jgi:hypothetical protein
METERIASDDSVYPPKRLSPNANEGLLTSVVGFVPSVRVDLLFQAHARASCDGVSDLTPLITIQRICIVFQQKRTIATASRCMRCRSGLPATLHARGIIVQAPGLETSLGLNASCALRVEHSRGLEFVKSDRW